MNTVTIRTRRDTDKILQIIVDLTICILILIIYIIKEAQCNSRRTIHDDELSMTYKEKKGQRYNTDIEIDCMHKIISRYKIELFCFVLS